MITAMVNILVQFSLMKFTMWKQNSELVIIVGLDKESLG